MGFQRLGQATYLNIGVFLVNTSLFSSIASMTNSMVFIQNTMKMAKHIGLIYAKSMRSMSQKSQDGWLSTVCHGTSFESWYSNEAAVVSILSNID